MTEQLYIYSPDKAKQQGWEKTYQAFFKSSKINPRSPAKLVDLDLPYAMFTFDIADGVLKGSSINVQVLFSLFEPAFQKPFDKDEYL